MTIDPVLQTVARVAADATGAASGWVVHRRRQRLEVVATTGPTAVTAGTRLRDGDGVTALVMDSGEVVALAVRPGDDAAPDVAVLLGRPPSSVLCAPCENEGEPVGAIVLADKAGGERFSFDDVELAGLLATVAGAAMAGGGRRRIPSPDDLASALRHLADADPARYATVALAVGEIVAGG